MLELFGTYFRENPDYSYQDALAESRALFIRQLAIQDFASGKISLDDLLAVLESQGFSPDDYVEAVGLNLDILGF